MNIPMSETQKSILIAAAEHLDEHGGLATLENADHAIGRSKIDTYCSSHIYFLPSYFSGAKAGWKAIK